MAEANGEVKKYTREDIQRTFEMYYDMKIRNLIGLSTLSGVPIDVIEDWNKRYNWDKKLQKLDYNYGKDTYSRIRRQTVRQQNCIDVALKQIEDGNVTDIHRIAKVVTSVNDTRNSLLKERQYDDLQQQLQVSSGNEELLQKLEKLQKDMKDIGVGIIDFDGSGSIIEGEEEDGAQS